MFTSMYFENSSYNFVVYGLFLQRMQTSPDYCIALGKKYIEMRDDVTETLIFRSEFVTPKVYNYYKLTNVRAHSNFELTKKTPVISYVSFPWVL